jgi:hypothetical protein
MAFDLLDCLVIRLQKLFVEPGPWLAGVPVLNKCEKTALDPSRSLQFLEPVHDLGAVVG